MLARWDKVLPNTRDTQNGQRRNEPRLVIC